MKTKTIQYEEYLNKVKELNRMKQEGIILIHKKNILKRVLGGVCIGVGIITLPFPTGSIFLIGFGCACLGCSISLDKIKKKIKSLIKRLKQNA